MIAADQTAEFSLPAPNLRALVRRALVPALIAAVAVVFVAVAGGRVHAVAGVLHRALHAGGPWTVAAVALECVSVAGYVALLALVGGRASGRIGLAESAQMTLAGTAATRLLPTAGAGGAALTLWSLNRAGLTPARAARTLLSFLVLLYSVFLGAIVLAGLALALGLATNHGPEALSAVPAAAAALAIAAALGLAFRRGGDEAPGTTAAPGIRRRFAQGAALLGAAVRDACGLVRTGDLRLIGAPVYWGCDAAVLWAMLHAFGASPSIAVVVLAYFVGQVANTLPVPGSVSGGIAGVLIAFGLPPAIALAAVLAYRTIAVWLPVPLAVTSLTRLRRTVGRWTTQDALTAHVRARPPAAACRRGAPENAGVAGVRAESTRRNRSARPVPA